MPILGTLNVQVSHNKQVCFSLVIVTGSGPSLLNHDWLKKVKWAWHLINHLHLKTLKDLLEEHKVEFEEHLGRLYGFEAKYFVHSSVSPRFCKARSVHHLMLLLMNEKLDQLVKEKVIEPIGMLIGQHPLYQYLKVTRKQYKFVVILSLQLTELQS